jgi:hypothetical protein
MAYEPIPTTGWSLQNTFIKADLPINYDILRRQLILITCAGMLFLVTLLSLFFRVYEGGQMKLWLASGLVSIILLSGIGAIWYLSLLYDSEEKGESITIVDRETLSKIKSTYAERSDKRNTDPPTYIPTGVFIESARFADVDDVIMTGYIWQRYDESIANDLSREFIIPYAEDIKIKEIFREKKKGKKEEFIRWHFQARLRQRFAHAKYPIEREIIELWIIHKDLNRNVVLVPDFPAYQLTNPTSLPGLDKGLTIPGWELIKSSFELVEKGVDPCLGVRQTMMQETFPMFRYNIVIKRNFIDSFISNLTPVIVVAFMLFVIMLTMTSDIKLIEKMRAGTGLTLSLCSALFIVVTFSHIGVRRRILAEEIFYLEYFYFVIYAAILFIAVSSIMFVMAKGVPFIQYQDNLLCKLLYWPILLGTLFCISIMYFY